MCGCLQKLGGPLPGGVPRPGQNEQWAYSLLGMGSGVQVAAVLRSTHHRGQKERKSQSCFLMLPHEIRIQSTVELRQKERPPTDFFVLFGFEVKGRRNAQLKYKAQLGEENALCITDASCEDSHLFFLSSTEHPHPYGFILLLYLKILFFCFLYFQYRLSIHH